MKKVVSYIIPVIITALCACGGDKVTDAREAGCLPDIFPDYIGVTVPATIAPLNFCSADAATEKIDVVIKGARTGEIHCSADGAIDIPADEWKKLLADNRGDSLSVTVCTRGSNGWTSYTPFGIYVSDDDIDYGIAYRLVAPGYEKYGKMGIYERSLADFRERPVFENTRVTGSCVNCHSFNRCDPSSMSMHVRGAHGGTVIRTSAGMKAYDTRTDSTVSACVYPYWHPGGRYIAYSTNQTHQMIHTETEKVVEVFDDASDVQVCDLQTGQLIVAPALNTPDVWETFPAFSPDGKWLYFCAAAAQPLPDSVRSVRYDLCRVQFDPSAGTVGSRIDTLVLASAAGKSVSMPRPSFDGRHLVYTLSDYGTFPIWHDEADLWILDLADGTSRPLDAANSARADSYHNFSSNSRWLVFGSRRLDGLYTRPFIAHIDADGNPSKPFLLPQRSPREYYDNCYRSFNIPEFITGAVDFDAREAADIITSDGREKLKPINR